MPTAPPQGSAVVPLARAPLAAAATTAAATAAIWGGLLAVAACAGSSSAVSTLPTFHPDPSTTPSSTSERVESTAAATSAPTSAPPASPASTATSTAGSTPASSSSGAPTPSWSPDPSGPWTALPTIASGPNQGVHQGVVVSGQRGRTAAERAALDTFTAYWQQVTAALYAAKGDPTALKRVMLADQAKSIEAYLAGLRSRNAHTVGWVVFDVTVIGVTGQAAAISGCGTDGSADVDVATGRAAQSPHGPLTFDAGLHRTASGWRVSSMRVTFGPCTGFPL